MSVFIHNYVFIVITGCTLFVLPFVTSYPMAVRESPYGKFIDFLSQNNCTMPKEVKLPFPPSSDPTPFSYLDAPLEKCQTGDALKDNNEANLLCREVFDVLQNITCFENGPLPQIDSNHLSEDICKDFKNMQDVLPKRDDYLSAKLVDSMICKILCTTDNYELLCRTLLWSYDTQAKIKNAVKYEVKEPEIESMNGAAPKEDALENEVKDPEKESTNGVTSNTASTTIKIKLGQDKSELANQKIDNKNVNKPLNNDNLNTDDQNLHDNGLNPSNSDLESSNAKMINSLNEIASNKIDSSSTKNEVITKTTDVIKNVNATVPPEKKKQKLPEETVDNKDDFNNSSNPNQQNHKLNEIDEHLPPKPITLSKTSEGKDNIDQVNSVTQMNSLTSNITGVKDNQSDKNMSESNLQNKEQSKDTINSDMGIKTNEKTEESALPKDKTNNDLNEIIKEQENEAKDKQTDVKTNNDQSKKVEKLKDLETSPGINSKLLESSTVQVYPDEDGEQHQEDKDQDQYNDTENESDYPKAEYDNSFNPPQRNREPGIKSSIIAGSSQISNNYDPYIGRPNNIGRIPDDIPMIPAFPEQEDSHFFFYFLSIVLILMAGYLIFHNKQKIIALIVEGRHERRRRSHGAGYKKLETK